MHGDPPFEYVLARRALLNALDALEQHAAGLTLVGAQAVYLHTGPAAMAVPEYTTDADVAVAPDLIAKTPLIEEALGAAGFRRGHDPGRWVDTNGIHLDLLVPDLLAGPGRRGADLGPHGRHAARRVHGLEGALVDRELMNIGSMEAEDPRNLEVWVAGTAALIVAKTIKTGERANEPAERSTRMPSMCCDSYRTNRLKRLQILCGSCRPMIDPEPPRTMPWRTYRRCSALQLLSGPRWLVERQHPSKTRR